MFVVEIWILLHVIYPLAFSEMSKILHVIDPLNFSELSKIHWPFKAVVIESIYDEVSELEASQMTRRPRRILIGLICHSFKDRVCVSYIVAKGTRQVFRDRKASF